MSSENSPAINWSGLEADLAEAAIHRRQVAVDRLLRFAGEPVDDQGDEQARWLDPTTGNAYNLLHLYDVPIHGAEVYIVQTKSVLYPAQSASVMFYRDSPEVAVLDGAFATELQNRAMLEAVLESVLENGARIVSEA